MSVLGTHTEFLFRNELKCCRHICLNITDVLQSSSIHGEHFEGARRHRETSLMIVGSVPVQQQLCVCVCVCVCLSLSLCVRARECVRVMNCLTDYTHDLDLCPVGGTDCWVKVQACFYAQLYVTSPVFLHRKPS
jgi:hypothetical protein